jgi:hypothetical protein
MKVKYFLAILFIALLFHACNKANKDSVSSTDIILNNVKQEDNKGIQQEQEMDRTPMDSTISQTGGQEQKKQPSPHIDWDKKIIRTAQLSIEVKDYKTFSNSLNTLVKKFGGYIATEQEVKQDERIENRISIKVPIVEFQELMNAINNSGEKITDRQISSEDVTTEVIDTKSRIEAKKEIRQRYLDFLKQAKSMQDILSIQSEINEVQEEIEMAAGRVEYLNHSAAYSTIELYYYQILKASAINDKPTFGNKISEAFKGGWEVLKDLLVVMVTIWPIWIISITIFFFYKRRKHILTGKSSATA